MEAETPEVPQPSPEPANDVIVNGEVEQTQEQNGEIDKTEETKDEGKQSPIQEEENKWAKKSTDEEGFNIRSFNDNILEFTEIIDSEKYRNVDEDYPVDDLINVVAQISDTIQEFKRQNQESQEKLEGLRQHMKTVKESIHFSVSRKAFEIRPGKIGLVYVHTLTLFQSYCDLEVGKTQSLKS